MAKNDNLEWTEVDTSVFTGAVKKSYDAYRAKAREASAMREAFEDTFKAAARKGKHIGDSQDMLFSHRFGKLSMAITDGPAAKASTSKRSAFKL